MTDIIWPITLPQDMLVQGLKETPVDNAVRTKTETGPFRSRRRSTGRWYNVEGVLSILQEDLSILDEFYFETTRDGTLPFQWLLPISGYEAEFVFSGPPSNAVRSGEWINVTLKFQARKL